MNAFPSILLCVMALTGCGTSSLPRYYMLVPNQAAVPLPRSNPGQARIGIDAITLPEVVDRPQLVLRSNTHEVGLAQDRRWAEPLKQAIPRLLAQHLAQRLDNPLVAALPQRLAIDPDYRVQLDIQRFEGRLGEAVLVEASWAIRQGNGELLASGRPLVRQAVASGSHEDLVAAYVRALSAIGDELADRLRALPSPR